MRASRIQYVVDLRTPYRKMLWSDNSAADARRLFVQLS
jgi:hypothetical protein